MLEKASALKSGFDAGSLASLSWALTAANVSHHRTVAELAGPAAALLKSFTPTQVGCQLTGGRGRPRSGRDVRAARRGTATCGSNGARTLPLLQPSQSSRSVQSSWLTVRV